MSPRGPRLAAALTLLAAGLFAGRWLSGFLADRWWAASVSAEAGVALTSRALTGLGLDAIGVAIALVWFSLNARAILLAVAELGARERGGNAAFRAALQQPRAWFWVGMATVLLALLVGTGVSEWEPSITLAGSGLRFGLADPALGIDAGWYVSRLPLWLRLQAFATVLLLVALGGVGAIHLLTGALRIGRGRLAITDQARRHLGVLLALLAVLIGTSRVLAPYELAAGIPMPVVPGVVHLYRSAGMVMAGLALAAAGVSVLWAVRPAHGMAAGAWLALSAALVGGEALLPADRPDPRDPAAAEAIDRFEAVSYGLRNDAPAREPVRLSLWDRAPLVRLVAGDSADPMLAMRGPWPVQGAFRPVWYVVGRAESPGLTRLIAIADDTASGSGQPLSWQRGALAPDSALVSVAQLPRLAARPGAPAIARGESGGIALGGLPRRIALAWSLQAGGLVTAEEPSVGWHLVPAARLRHLAPWAVWSGTRPWLMDGRLVWLVDGYSVTDAFPVSRRRSWEGRVVSYARAGFLGLVDAGSGGVEIFLRPGADSLSSAWAAVSRGLVRGAASIPAGVAAAVGYPEDVLLLQADLLASRGVPERSEGALAVGTRAYPLPGPSATSATVPLVRRASGIVSRLVIGQRTEAGDRIGSLALDSARSIEEPGVLQRQWQRLPLMVGIRDSVLAAGSDTLFGAVRYALRDSALTAWQPVWAVGPGGAVRLVAVGVARGERFGAGRGLSEALASLAADRGALAGLTGPMGALEEARRWVQEADSALRRGDLAAFAKAFGALREALQGAGPPPPK